ncbi:MAG: VanZ family protein [Clostridiaceae bacterium]|nr:VanZ family protein [Clostridiaceae bacterium]
MNKRSVNINSLVLLLALLSLLLEIFIYYFIPQHYITVIVAAVISLALSHFFLETSLEYKSCLLHASFMTITTAGFCVIVYSMQPNEWIQYDYWTLCLVLINWLVPYIYCFVRDFADRGPRFDCFHFFFHGMSIIFILIYLLAIAKQFFITPYLPPFGFAEFGAHNFIPFMTTGSYFENAISLGIDLTPAIVYLIETVVFFIPFGFLARIYCRNVNLFSRVLAYLCFPLLLELLQYFTGLGRGDIDDYALALIGTLIGIAIYHIVYAVSYSFHKRDFLEDRTVTKKLLFHFGGSL